jgi:hypothetical protein
MCLSGYISYNILILKLKAMVLLASDVLESLWIQWSAEQKKNFDNKCNHVPLNFSNQE